ELGRAPSIEEVAVKMGEALENLRILPRLAPAASIDEILSAQSERGGEVSVLVDANDPADAAIDAARRDAISHAMASLPDEESAAVRMLLYEGLTVAEARERTGASARQLRARCARGREQLAEVLAEWAPVG